MHTQITAILDAVRQCNDSRFLSTLQRQSNNRCPQFSDQELIGLCLWGKAKHLPTRKAIYEVGKECFSNLFPNLPSYQAFCRRLNRIADAFRVLAEIWLERPGQDPFVPKTFVLDSCPIQLARHTYSNFGKVARECCSLTYNSTRKEFYYGMKLTAFGQLRPGKIPWPCALVAGDAKICDLWTAQQIMRDSCPIWNGILYADRAYIDAAWKEELQKFYNIKIITPRKKAKYDTLVSKDAFSESVASERQPIESFFNWLNFHTGIQDAHYIRSTSGLLFHIFSSFALAAFVLHFNY